MLGDHSHRSRIKVCPELRRRVLTIALRLGYRPHRYAQVTRKGKSGAVGMIQFGGFLQVHARMAIHAAKAIQGDGYQLVTSDILRHREGVRDAVNAMLDAVSPSTGCL